MGLSEWRSEPVRRQPPSQGAVARAEFSVAKQEEWRAALPSGPADSGGQRLGSIAERVEVALAEETYSERLVELHRLASRLSAEECVEAAKAGQAIDSPPLQQEFLAQVAARWSEVDAPAAAGWCESIEQPQLREKMAETIVAEWAQRQPDMAAAWTGRLPQGGTRERAEASLGAIWARVAPRQAAAFVDGLEFLRFCGLGCEDDNDSHEQQQMRSALRP
jgi:hypothetical protein